jgi:hypothetical protein
MAQPIYKLWFMRYKEAWYKLTPAERDQLMAKDQESLKEAGAESIVMCVSGTFNEQWLGWGVEKYPSLEAMQKHTMRLFEIDWFEYIESKTCLGTEMPSM